VMRQLRRMDEENLVAVEVKREVMERYNDQIQADIEKVDVWHGDCSNYYQAESGRIVTQYPHGSAVFRDATNRPDHDDFLFRPGLALAARRAGGGERRAGGTRG